MPAVSQAQRGYLAAKFGPEWLKRHHFDNPGKLPERVGKKKRKRGRVKADAVNAALAKGRR